jgi:hypothetical protein
VIHFHTLRSGMIDYKYNPSQPRDKAGRWTSGGGELSSVDSIPRKELNWEGERGKIARKAIKEHVSGESELLALRKDGKVKAITLLESDESTCLVSYLATAERGHGANMMRSIARKAAKEGKGVELYCTKSSESFYKAIGMKQGKGDERDVFTFSKSAAKKFAESGKTYPMVNIASDEELAELEPEDGVFSEKK